MNNQESINKDSTPEEYSSYGNEIILYQPDSTLALDVRVENETVWLTQVQLVELFASSKANVSEHIKNILSPVNWIERQLFGNSEQFELREVVPSLEIWNTSILMS